MNWSLNAQLPRGDLFRKGALGTIATELGLSREQVRTQLVNFKEAKYGNSQVSLLLNAEEPEEKMRLSLSVETVEFVTSVLERIHTNCITSSREFNNFTAVLDAFPSDARIYVKLLSVSPKNPGVLLLRNVVEKFIVSAAEKFPKKAAGLSSAEVEFQREIIVNKTHFVGSWLNLHESSGTSVSRKLFGRLGQFFHMVMYHEWTHAAIDSERPSVEIPGSVAVNRHARPVIYYVAGWTLFSASRALTVAGKERGKYFLFVQAHSIGKLAAQVANLPISIIEKRKRKSAKVYCSEEYFDFICYVESVYLSNLSLKMMRAYADGNIIDIIRSGLLSNDTVIQKFSLLFQNPSCCSMSEDEKPEILKYLMDRYANMRGTFFAHCLKKNNNKSTVDILAEKQATRTNVSNAVVTAKAVADSKESELWRRAGDNACNYADEADI